MALKANARYPFPPHCNVEVCDGTRHVAFNTTSDNFATCMARIETAPLCDGGCKGWFAVKRRARK